MVNIVDKPFYPENSVIQAPLAGYTDAPFRIVCRQFGCRYAFTPLVEAGMLVYKKNCDQYHPTLMRDDCEDWLGVQLLGSNPGRLREAVKRLNCFNYDVLDFNMGCPVKKVTKRKAGVALCKDQNLALTCLNTVIRESSIPVTAKIRVLCRDTPSPTVILARQMENIGVSAISIHGRTADQLYSGPVAYNVIKAVNNAVKIPVIANGGVTDRRSASNLRVKTGCSRVMIGRGSIGNPWLFSELFNADHVPPSPEEVCRVIEQHVRLIVGVYGEERGIRHARKIIAAYIKGLGLPSTTREKTNKLVSLQDMERFLGHIKGFCKS